MKMHFLSTLIRFTPVALLYRCREIRYGSDHVCCYTHHCCLCLYHKSLQRHSENCSLHSL